MQKNHTLVIFIITFCYIPPVTSWLILLINNFSLIISAGLFWTLNVTLVIDQRKCVSAASTHLLQLCLLSSLPVHIARKQKSLPLSFIFFEYLKRQPLPQTTQRQDAYLCWVSSTTHSPQRTNWWSMINSFPHCEWVWEKCHWSGSREQSKKLKNGTGIIC